MSKLQSKGPKFSYLMGCSGFGPDALVGMSDPARDMVTFSLSIADAPMLGSVYALVVRMPQ